MNFFYAFLVGGILALIAQIILDHTKLTPGHITSLFVVLGAFLGFLGIYPKILNLAHAGASVPITSFGNLLYQASYTGYLKNGLLGMWTNSLATTGGVISATIIFSLIWTLFLKARD